MLPQGISCWVAWTVVGFLGQTSQQLDGARPGHLVADGVKAYQHDRRVAPAMTLTLRRSLTAPFEKQSPFHSGACCLPVLQELQVAGCLQRHRCSLHRESLIARWGRSSRDSFKARA